MASRLARRHPRAPASTLLKTRYAPLRVTLDTQYAAPVPAALQGAGKFDVLTIRYGFDRAGGLDLWNICSVGIEHRLRCRGQDLARAPNVVAVVVGQDDMAYGIPAETSALESRGGPAMSGFSPTRPPASSYSAPTGSLARCRSLASAPGDAPRRPQAEPAL